jgi:WD40 repeat protein
MGLIALIAATSLAFQTPEANPEIVIQRGHQGDTVTSFAITPDGATALTGGTDGLLKQWDLATGTLVRNLSADPTSVDRIAVSPDGTVAATGGAGRIVRLYDLKAGQEIRSFPALDYNVTALAFATDGKTLFAADRSDKGVRQWDITSGNVVRSIGTRVVSEQIAVSPDGTRIAIGTPEPAVEVFTVATGELVKKLPMTGQTFPRRLTFVGGPDRLAATDGDRVVAWEVASGNVVGPAQRRTGTVTGFSGDGRSYLSLIAKGDGAAKTAFPYDLGAFGVEDDKPAGIVEGGGKPMVAAVSGERMAVAHIGPNNALRIDSLAGAVGKPQQIQRLPGSAAALRDVLLTPDRKVLATGWDDGRLRLWNATKIRLEQALDTGGPVQSLDVSPDGNLLYTGSSPKGGPSAVKVWDLATGAVKQQFAPHALELTFMGLSADGKRLWTNGSDPGAEAGTVRRASQEWSSESLARLEPSPEPAPSPANGDPLPVHPMDRLYLGQMRWGTTWVRLAKNRKHLLDAFGTQVLPLTEAQLTTAQAAFEAAGENPGTVLWSKDGKFVVVGASDGSLQVWNSLENQRGARMQANEPLLAREFSPDNSSVLATNRSGDVLFFDPLTGSLRATLALLPLPDPTSTRSPWIAFTPQGHYTGSGDAESFIRWRVGDVLRPGTDLREQLRRPELVEQAFQ